ncbi:MAG TPA: serine hydrolase [Bacteroidetes bacterium]|nr:serine hydrolase [Bacteroidota bacterium]
MIRIVLITCFLQFMPAQTKKDFGELKLSIDSIIVTHKGTFAVSFKDISTGVRVDINAHEYFHAASTMKTPVMIEVFNQAKQNKFALNDSIPVVNSFKSIIDGTEYSLQLSDDSEDGLYNRIGKLETIRNLVVKMITVSSNLSTNILIEKVGPENVMRTLATMGLKDIQVLRGVEDGKAYDAGKNNTTTSFDLSIIYESIALKKCISKQASEEMLEILLSQKFKDMIPAKLPPPVKVAHKTGSITNVQHDSGIIFLPDGRSYILVVLSKNLASNKEGIEAISSISKRIYDFMME